MIFLYALNKISFPHFGGEKMNAPAECMVYICRRIFLFYSLNLLINVCSCLDKLDYGLYLILQKTGLSL